MGKYFKIKESHGNSKHQIGEEDAISKWWDKNYEKAIEWVSNNSDVLGDMLYEDEDELDAFNDSTAKHQALDGLYTLGIKGFEELMNDDDN